MGPKKTEVCQFAMLGANDCFAMHGKEPSAR